MHQIEGHDRVGPDEYMACRKCTMTYRIVLCDIVFLSGMKIKIYVDIHVVASG